MTTRKHWYIPAFRRSLETAVLFLLLSSLTGLCMAQQTRSGEPQMPANPDAIKATWMIGETPHSLTQGEFHKWHTLLTRLEGSANRGVNENRVWEFLLSVSEADALGMVVTEEEVDGLVSQDDPDLYEGILARWSAVGVTPEDGRRHAAAQQKINRMKDLLLNNMRITTEDAFDVFKERHMSYKVQYVLFAAEDVVAQFETELDESKLKRFWSEDRAIQNEFRTKNTVSAEIVFLDPSSSVASTPAASNKTVSRAEALRYFQVNKDSLKKQIPPEKQHLLALSSSTELEDVVTPFSLLEDTIKQKLLHGAVLEQALAAAQEEGADLKAVAAKLGLGFEKVDSLDRASAIRRLTRFGYQAFTFISGGEVGEVCPDVQTEKGITWFFRLNDKQPSKLPSFEEIKPKLRKRYLERMATQLCRKKGQDFIGYMRAQVSEEVAGLEKEIEKRAEEETNRRVQELGLTKPQDIARERMRARSTIRQEIEAKKRELMPKHFDAYAKDQGLRLKETDFFEFNPYRVDRTQISDIAESRMAFLTTNYYLRSLTVGQVTSVLLEDPHTSSFLVCKIIDRKDPSYDAMGPVEYTQAMAQLRQTNENQFLQRFRFVNISKRVNLKQEGN